MNKLFVIAVLGFIASSFAIKPIEFGENPFQQRHFPEWVNRVPISNVRNIAIFVLFQWFEIELLLCCTRIFCAHLEYLPTLTPLICTNY